MFADRITLAMLIALTAGGISLAETEGKKADAAAAHEETEMERRSVSAKVVSTVGEGAGIRAKKVPGEFTVPEGSTAKNFKYKFYDPMGNVKLDKLTGSSIYSVTERRYITEAADHADLELRPGKYKFVVGGRPGANGSLSFDLAPADSTSVVIRDDVPATDIPDPGKISVVIWVPNRSEYKFRWIFDIKKGGVTGVGELDGPPHPSPAIVNEKSDYRFQGKVIDKRIKGVASQKLTWEAVKRDGSTMKHIYEGEGDLEIQLRVDHTAVGSEVHSGRTNGKSSVQKAIHNWVGKWTMEKN